MNGMWRTILFSFVWCVLELHKRRNGKKRYHTCTSDGSVKILLVLCFYCVYPFNSHKCGLLRRF